MEPQQLYVAYKPPYQLVSVISTSRSLLDFCANLSFKAPPWSCLSASKKVTARVGPCFAVGRNDKKQKQVVSISVFDSIWCMFKSHVCSLQLMSRWGWVNWVNLALPQGEVAGYIISTGTTAAAMFFIHVHLHAHDSHDRKAPCSLTFP